MQNSVTIYTAITLNPNSTARSLNLLMAQSEDIQKEHAAHFHMHILSTPQIIKNICFLLHRLFGLTGENNNKQEKQKFRKKKRLRSAPLPLNVAYFCNCSPFMNSSCSGTLSCVRIVCVGRHPSLELSAALRNSWMKLAAIALGLDTQQHSQHFTECLRNKFYNFWHAATWSHSWSAPNKFNVECVIEQCVGIAFSFCGIINWRKRRALPVGRIII